VRVAADHAPVVSRFEGKRFNSPSDVVFAKHGALYFTDLALRSGGRARSQSSQWQLAVDC
jgi:hypothetical protein